MKKEKEPTRRKRISCLVSEKEEALIEHYLKRYNITNRSRWMRENLIAFILKNLEHDYPTLFTENDMRR